MIQYRKYGTQCTILFPLIKSSSQNFAVSGDYTHASGDVKISKDGGAAATATNSPSALTMGNGAVWTLTLSATEMQAAEIVVTLIDATTKAVEDQCIIIHTYGNASAMLVPDLSVANLAANVTQFGGTNATTSGGRPEVNTTHIAGSAVSTSSAQIGVNVVNAAGTSWNAGAIKAATLAAETGLSPVRSNTCQSGSTSTTIKLDASASSTDDFYKYQTVTITGGTGAGQSAIIDSYVGSTKVATVNKTWATTPNATSTFCILRESELQSSGSVSLGTNAPSGWINEAAFATGAITSNVLATNAASEVASAVRTELTTELGLIDSAISGIPSAATISSTVWSETTRTLSNPAGLQKNTAVSNFNFVLVDSSDNPVTGATVTSERSIDGGSFASCTNSASEIGSGVYKINLSASDLNGDVVTLKFTATGAKSRLITIFTEP